MLMLTEIGVQRWCEWSFYGLMFLTHSPARSVNRVHSLWQYNRPKLIRFFTSRDSAPVRPYRDNVCNLYLPPLPAQEESHSVLASGAVYWPPRRKLWIDGVPEKSTRRVPSIWWVWLVGAVIRILCKSSNYPEDCTHAGVDLWPCGLFNFHAAFPRNIPIRSFHFINNSYWSGVTCGYLLYRHSLDLLTRISTHK